MGCKVCQVTEHPIYFYKAKPSCVRYNVAIQTFYQVAYFRAGIAVSKENFIGLKKEIKNFINNLASLKK